MKDPLSVFDKQMVFLVSLFIRVFNVTFLRSIRCNNIGINRIRQLSIINRLVATQL